MIIVGITGKAGSGKDTVGEILRDFHDFGIMSFASPIKKIVCMLLNEDVNKWNDRAWRETGVPIWNASPRRMAQTLGTEWGRRALHPDLWLDLAFDRVANAAESVAITDVRFNNEAERIRAFNNGHIIHVHRAESDASPEALQHASEEGIYTGNRDFHINNFGTIDTLAMQVHQIVEQAMTLQKDADARDIEETANIRGEETRA